MKKDVTFERICLKEYVASGRKYDKFKETGLTPLPAKKVRAPIIKECVAHLECKLHKRITAGDHTLFVGEILTAYVNEGNFKQKKYNIKRVKIIYHLGGNYFATLAPKVVRPRLSQVKTDRNGLLSRLIVRLTRVKLFRLKPVPKIS